MSPAIECCEGGGLQSVLGLARHPHPLRERNYHPPFCPSSAGYARHYSSAGQFLSCSCYLSHCSRQVLHPSTLLPFQLLLQFRLCPPSPSSAVASPQVEVNKVPVELFTGFAAPRRPKSLKIQREVYCDSIIIVSTVLGGLRPPLTVI